MGVVLELRVAVDPTVDADVAGLACLGEAHGLGDRDLGDHGEQAADAVARAEAAQDRGGDAEGEHACGTEEEGTHARIIGPGMEGPGGTYPTRGL